MTAVDCTIYGLDLGGRRPPVHLQSRRFARSLFGLDSDVVGFDLFRFGLDLGGRRPPLHAPNVGAVYDCTF